MSEAIYYDGWHTCANCGADKGGEDIWRDTCPRCAELAQLEREIGRAYCYQAQALNARSRSTDLRVNYMLTDAAIYAEKHADALIARWRQLHAGAEGER